MPACAERFPHPPRSSSASTSPASAGEVQLRTPCALRMKLLRLPRAAEQKHALLAEHVPEPPGQVQPQREAVEIDRARASHLAVDVVEQLDELLDLAQKDVR